jgi:hypothetical protein
MDVAHQSRRIIGREGMTGDAKGVLIAFMIIWLLALGLFFSLMLRPPARRSASDRDQSQS